ncbi:MAG: hypothetical protein HYS23_06250 [Geobacter sp.]|nr:hypothetical protein [Geobacter sp.]
MKANTIEYVGELLSDGHISIPGNIKRRLGKKKYRINVTIELEETEKGFGRGFSFGEVRKLLAPIRGELAQDVISDREDRL